VTLAGRSEDLLATEEVKRSYLGAGHAAR